MTAELGAIPVILVAIFLYGVVARPALALGLAGIVFIVCGATVSIVLNGPMFPLLGAILFVGGFGLVGIGAGVRILEKIHAVIEAERAYIRPRSGP